MGSLQDEGFFRGQDIIDLQIGLENSGSEDAYLALLKLMYESSDVYINELDAFYAAMDLKNYTVKVHALKSSTRIIGAVGAGEKAQFLEYAAKAGDEVADAIVTEVCGRLGSMVAKVVNVLNPEMVLLGGGVSKAGQIIIDKMRPAFRSEAFHACKDTKVNLAVLGNDAGIYGGVGLLLN